MKALIEREVFLRSAKHVLNNVIKEQAGETDLHMAQCLAHLLNCLFAPTAMINALNQGRCKLEDNSVQNSFPFFPETTVSSPRRASMDHGEIANKE